MKTRLALGVALLVFAAPASVTAQPGNAGASWGVDTRNLSSTVRPGDDFYRYVNEGWLKTARAPDGVPYIDAFVEVFLRTEERIGGIIHRPQPPATLARMRTALGSADPFTLAALRNLASLAHSLVVGLAALEPDADPHALWLAANLEEDWQAELWGKDAEAMERRDRRFAAFAAAMRFAELARG